MTRIGIRFLPRDAMDVFLSILIFPYYIFIYCIIPGVVTFLMTWSWPIALVVGGVFFVVAIICMNLITVWGIRLDDQGIRFQRVLGWPGLIPWEEIAEMKVVGRGELFWRGWVWPPCPPRELTTSTSTLGHVKIVTWGGRSTYFPPASIPGFKEAVEHYWPGLASEKLCLDEWAEG